MRSQQRYDVTALLGEGGMGQVWQATDTQLNRPNALSGFVGLDGSPKVERAQLVLCGCSGRALFVDDSL